MVKHVNFYENIQEALMRVRSTIVLYQDDPHYIFTVTDHKGDGVFRVYMTPLTEVNTIDTPPPLHQIPHGHHQMGNSLDAWMKENPKAPFLRKKMNSPYFNQFRPFPLGMINIASYAYYLERQPVRPKSEQGLTPQMIVQTRIDATNRQKGPIGLDIYSQAMVDCIKGDHPSPKKVLEGLLNPDFDNQSVAFNRSFALVRGPIDILFLAYKDDVVGVLPQSDFSVLRLGKKFKHLRESVEELSLFSSIQ